MSQRIRVRDKCTGYIRTIDAAAAAHGDYEVLKDAQAVDPRTGDDLPPEFPKKKARTSEPPSGRQADTKKEND